MTRAVRDALSELRCSPAVADALAELRRMQDRRRAVLAFALALGVEVKGGKPG